MRFFSHDYFCFFFNSIKISTLVCYLLEFFSFNNFYNPASFILYANSSDNTVTLVLNYYETIIYSWRAYYIYLFFRFKFIISFLLIVFRSFLSKLLCFLIYAELFLIIFSYISIFSSSSLPFPALNISFNYFTFWLLSKLGILTWIGDLSLIKYLCV